MTFFFPIHNPDEGVYAGVVVHDFKVLMLKHKKSDFWFFPHGFSLLSEVPDDTILRICREQASIIGELVDYSPIANQKDVDHCALPMHSEIRMLDNHKYYCSYFLLKAKNPRDTTPSEGIEEARWLNKEELLNLNLPQGIIDICILALERDINLEF
jgi:hypothetical protein